MSFYFDIDNESDYLYIFASLYLFFLLLLHPSFLRLCKRQNSFFFRYQRLSSQSHLGTWRCPWCYIPSGCGRSPNLYGLSLFVFTIFSHSLPFHASNSNACYHYFYQCFGFFGSVFSGRYLCFVVIPGFGTYFPIFPIFQEILD